MRAAVRHLKTLPDTQLVTLLTARLSDILLGELSERQQFGFPRRIVFVPIPLSRKRFIERGYNQATLIAKELAASIPKSQVEEVLKRTTRYTKQALVTDRENRFQNQSGSMIVKEILDPNIGYIIVDDVSTSGATLAEAKRALKTAGARHVIAAVLAH